MEAIEKENDALKGVLTKKILTPGDRLINFKLKKDYGDYSKFLDSTQKDRIDEIKTEITKMKNAIKKEKQINRKVEYQVRLRKLNQELRDILGVKEQNKEGIYDEK